VSTIKVNEVQPTAVGGGVKIDGLQMPTAGALSNRNLIINGAMTVAQRGTSFTNQTASGFGVDRFQYEISSAGTWTISQSTDAPDGFVNSMKYDCTTANTSLGSTAQLYFLQKIEAQNLQHLAYGSSAAQAITFSFYFKTNKTGVYTVELFQADSSRSIAFEMNVTQTGWQRYQFTIPGDTAGTINNDNDIGLWCFVWLAVGSGFTSGTMNNGAWATGTQANRLSSSQVNLADSTSNECFFTGVQLELGEKATPFEHRSYGDELARCQRYFIAIHDPRLRGVFNTAGTVNRVGLTLPTTMRQNPTYTTTGTYDIYDGSSIGTVTSFSASYTTKDSVEFDASPATGSFTHQAPAIFYVHTSTNQLNVDAEL
jgi:hypothetical protein